MHRHIATSALVVTLLAGVPTTTRAQAPAASEKKTAPKTQQKPAAGARVAPRAYITANAGYQGAGPALSNTYAFPLYVEPATVTATYASKAAMMFDVGGGVRVWRNLTIGLAVSHYAHDDPIGVSAQVPHPFFFNQFRSTQGSSDAAARTETVLHLQAMWSMAASTRTQLGIFAGPSRFAVTQAVISQTNFKDVFPYDTVSVGSVFMREQSVSRIGYNAGVDLTYLLRRARTNEVGAGALVRFSRASVPLTDASKNGFSARVGGLQVGAGVRLRF